MWADNSYTASGLTFGNYYKFTVESNNAFDYSEQSPEV